MAYAVSRQDSRFQLTRHRAEIKALTGVRFFAAMYVVLYHSKLPELLTQHHLFAAGNFLRNGGSAVSLFFILSGLILSYNYVDQLEKPSDWRRFWQARVARIWPMYLVSLFLSTVIVHTTPGFLRACATIAMVQAWNPVDFGTASAWNFVCWTLSVEAFFYLLFPFIQTWLRGRQSWAVALLAVSLCASMLLCTAHIDYASRPPLGGIPLALYRLPEFLIGMCIGNLFSMRVRDAQTRGLWTWAGALCSLYLLTHVDRMHIAFVAAGFGALLFGLATERTLLRSFLSTHLLVVGGAISYAIYLLQWPCKMAVNYAFDHWHPASAGVRSVADWIILIAISYIAFHAIEDPAQKRLRAAFLRWDTRPSAQMESLSEA